MANYKAEFSKAVLEGALKRGMSKEDIADTLGRSRAFVEEVLNAESKLSNGDLDSLERELGTTAGKLAVHSLKNPDPGLVAVMEASAAARAPSKRAPSKHVKTV